MKLSLRFISLLNNLHGINQQKNIQNILPIRGAKGQAFISAIILYSLAWDATDVIDDGNLATELSAQIRSAFSPGQKTIQATTQSDLDYALPFIILIITITCCIFCF